MESTETITMCERCTTRKSTTIVMFSEHKENMCIVCFDDMQEMEKGGLTYREWYRKEHKEVWTEKHALLDCFIDGYVSYCRKKGYEPFWDADCAL